MKYTRKQKEEYVNEIKTTVGCKHCGKEEPPKELHLHHIDGETKVDRVSQMLKTCSLEKIKNEIRKCEVLCRECHFSHHSYSKHDYIDALQEVAEELDKSPSQHEYREHRKDEHPSTTAIKDKFGGWNNAKEAAGLSVIIRSTNTKQDGIDALQYVAKEIDKSPSQREYRDHRKDEHPSATAIKDKFGSWNKAKEVAGLNTFAHGSGNKTPTVDTQGQLSFDQFTR